METARRGSIRINQQWRICFTWSDAGPEDADTALRLARFFGTSERFWINLQSRHDLEIEKDRLGPVLDSIRPLASAS